MITKITQNDLDLHAKWLKNEPDGVRLSAVAHADLSGANLRGTNLSYADLSGANLSGANLNSANLNGAKLDFAAWPLWCGSKGIKVDKRIASQLVAHVCALSCDDEEFQALRKLMLPFAKTSHRAEDLGLMADEGTR